MSAETDAYAVLAADGDVTAIVGDRIYPDFVPEEQELPAISITRANTEFINTIHGNAPVASLVTLEIWCLAVGRSSAEALADVVQTTMATSEFIVSGRRPEYDDESKLWATVLEMANWQ
jgi:hypothetical protein